MAIFRKKSSEYDDAANQMNNMNSRSSERIIFEQLENNDERVAYLIDQMKTGCPLVLDFGKLDVRAGNKMLAFFAGASYASDAREVKVNDTVYMFARRIDFIDGSLDEFLRNL